MGCGDLTVQAKNAVLATFKLSLMVTKNLFANFAPFRTSGTSGKIQIVRKTGIK